MPRNSERNAEVREERRKQILNAALTIYIRFGYHGADMDAVADEAQLAKGLVYYYYKTKKELFSSLYSWMFDEGYSFSNVLLENADGLNSIEQLMYYVYGMFCANRDNPRMMQFYIRAPFDAYAVFGPEQWTDGVAKSDMHRKALSNIIEQGISQSLIPSANPNITANSFWTVFVANVFEYSKLILGTQESTANEIDVFKGVVRFCFQGIGVEYSVWNSCLEKIIEDNKLRRGSADEDI